MGRCLECGREFETKHGLRTHVALKHKMLKCRCSKWLYRKYVEESMTMREIAEIDGCTPETIHWHLRRHGIPARHSGWRTDNVGMGNEMAYVLGAILSDGSSCRYRSNRSQGYRGYRNKLAVTDKTFADEFADKLESIGLLPSRHIETRNNTVYYVVQKHSKSIFDFVGMLRAYNSECLVTFDQKRNFIRGYYDGDGSLYRDRRVGREKNFDVKIISTSKRKIGFLSELMKDIGIKHQIYERKKNWNGINIEHSIHVMKQKDVALFMKLVGSSIPRKRINPSFYNEMEYNLEYTDDELLQCLKSFKERAVRAPTKREFDRDSSLPSSTTYAHRFGSWNAAKKLAGLTTFGPGGLVIQAKKEMVNIVS